MSRLYLSSLAVLRADQLAALNVRVRNSGGARSVCGGATQVGGPPGIGAGAWGGAHEVAGPPPGPHTAEVATVSLSRDAYRMFSDLLAAWPDPDPLLGSVLDATYLDPGSGIVGGDAPAATAAAAPTTATSLLRRPVVAGQVQVQGRPRSQRVTFSDVGPLGVEAAVAGGSRGTLPAATASLTGMYPGASRPISPCLPPTLPPELMSQASDGRGGVQGRGRGGEGVGGAVVLGQGASQVGAGGEVPGSQADESGGPGPGQGRGPAGPGQSRFKKVKLACMQAQHTEGF